MTHTVLALDVSGKPQAWLSLEEAIVYYSKDQVAWTLGTEIATLRGGFRRVDGSRSELTTSSIIAIKGEGFSPKKFRAVPLTNKTLFGRDRHVCAYCGNVHHQKDLSRDHIHPVSKGGLDTYLNCVTACKRCNHHKGAKTLDQAGMELLYIPYIPNRSEEMILRNRNILVDQMEYLLATVPKHSRLM